MTIAKRIYRIKGEPSTDVVVRIEMPVANGQDYKCSYSIEWPDEHVEGYAMGVDALQSLLLSAQQIGVQIYCLSYHSNRQLIWLEEGEGFGLPLPKNLVDLYEGDDPPV